MFGERSGVCERPSVGRLSGGRRSEGITFPSSSGSTPDPSPLSHASKSRSSSEAPLGEVYATPVEDECAASAADAIGGLGVE